MTHFRHVGLKMGLSKEWHREHLYTYISMKVTEKSTTDTIVLVVIHEGRLRGVIRRPKLRVHHSFRQ